MFTIIYQGVYIHCYIDKNECNYRDEFANKQVYAKSIRAAKNRISRMLKGK